jgi:hypothetical protein
MLKMIVHASTFRKFVEIVRVDTLHLFDIRRKLKPLHLSCVTRFQAALDCVPCDIERTFV